MSQVATYREERRRKRPVHGGNKPNVYDALHLWLKWAKDHAKHGQSVELFLRKLTPEHQKEAAGVIADLIRCLERWRQDGDL